MAPSHALLSLLCVALFVAASAEDCSLYSTCADCACKTVGYDINMACQIGTCSWCPTSGTCMSASDASCPGAAPIDHLFIHEDEFTSTNFTDDSDALEWRNLQLSQGVLCPLAYGSGTVVTVIICFSFAFLMTLPIVYLLAKDRMWCRRLRDNDDVQWLYDLMHAHLLDTDVVVWQGLGELPKPDHLVTQYLWMMSMTLIPLTVPSLLWLLIGLPYNIDYDWEFSFYYPICFVGGMGLLGSTFANVVTISEARPKFVYVCALTDTAFVTVKAQLDTRDLTGGQVTRPECDRILTMRVEGKKVLFRTASGNSEDQPHDIATPALRDTGPLFVLLQQRSQWHKKQRKEARRRRRRRRRRRARRRQARQLAQLAQLGSDKLAQVLRAQDSLSLRGRSQRNVLAEPGLDSDSSETSEDGEVGVSSSSDSEEAQWSLPPVPRQEDSPQPEVMVMGAAEGDGEPAAGAGSGVGAGAVQEAQPPTTPPQLQEVKVTVVSQA